MQGPNRTASLRPLASLPPPPVEGRNVLEPAVPGGAEGGTEGTEESECGARGSHPTKPEDGALHSFRKTVPSVPNSWTGTG